MHHHIHSQLTVFADLWESILQWSDSALPVVCADSRTAIQTIESTLQRSRCLWWLQTRTDSQWGRLPQIDLESVPTESGFVRLRLVLVWRQESLTLNAISNVSSSTCRSKSTVLGTVHTSSCTARVTTRGATIRAPIFAAAAAVRFPAAPPRPSAPQTLSFPLDSVQNRLATTRHRPTLGHDEFRDLAPIVPAPIVRRLCTTNKLSTSLNQQRRKRYVEEADAELSLLPPLLLWWLIKVLSKTS